MFTIGDSLKDKINKKIDINILKILLKSDFMFRSNGCGGCCGGTCKGTCIGENDNG